MVSQENSELLKKIMYEARQGYLSRSGKDRENHFVNNKYDFATVAEADGRDVGIYQRLFDAYVIGGVK